MTHGLTFSLPDLDDAWLLSCSGQMCRAHKLAQSLSRSLATPSPRVRGELSWQRAFFSLALGAYDDAIRHATTALEIFASLGLPEWQAMAQSVIVWPATILGDRHCVDDAFEILASIDLEGLPASWLQNAIAIAHWSNEQHDSALEWSERAVAGAERSGDELTIGRWLNNLALPMISGALAADASPDLQSSLTRRAVETLERSACLSERHADRWNLRIALSNLSEILSEAGRLAEAEACLSRLDVDSHLAPEPLSPRERLHTLQMRGSLLGKRGDFQGAIASLAECLSGALQLDDLESAGPASRKLAEYYAAAGDFERAYQTHRHFHQIWDRRANTAARSGARVAAIRYKARALARRAATLATDNARLSAETQLDPLTGLRNRRGLHGALRDAAAPGKVVSVALIDIDHFKRINDDHSHAIGDIVLCRIAGLLTERSSQDLSFRLGGEEFLLIMPGANLAAAAVVCESLRCDIERHDWNKLSPGLAVTVSIGLTCSTDAAGDEDLMARADAHLYAAKRGGRNRVEGPARVISLSKLEPMSY